MRVCKQNIKKFDRDWREKSNVKKFDEDARREDGYIFRSVNKLSSRLANERMVEGLMEVYDFSDKRILDIGCGDGSISIELLRLGAQIIVGMDPAESAIDVANSRAKSLKLTGQAEFRVGNIYNDSFQTSFDCVLLSGVLHHLIDPQLALNNIFTWADNLVITEPNGLNPILKILERVSSYHIEHEEQSFTASTLAKWLNKAGFKIKTLRYINLVPMFCPDWMAKLCSALTSTVESIPGLRNICCGSLVIHAEKSLK